MTSGPNIPRSQRKRPTREFSLSREAAQVVDALPRGTRSHFVSEAIVVRGEQVGNARKASRKRSRMQGN